MKLHFTYDSIQAMKDILIYLYNVSGSENGIFVDTHCKSYDIYILQCMKSDIVYNGIVFSLQECGDYTGVTNTIDRYRILTLEGDESKIRAFCKDAFNFSEERLNGLGIENKLNVFNFNFSWEYVECNDKRSLNTIDLPNNQITHIVNDMTQFVSKETREKYKTLGIAHSRMYMLYGPPGTGKTSLIKAIASHLNYSIGIIEFDKDIDDRLLKRAITKRPKNTILIFEDIDCLFESRKQSDTCVSNVTFSGLLNTFDGVVSHDNLIIIFTTNHMEILDHALKRRIDYFLKFDYASKAQIKAMYMRFYPSQEDNFEKFYEDIKHVKITPNILQKFFTKHLYDDISKYTYELCNFANGEIAVETLQNFYT